jgi:flagellar biosynthesis GTPase FlhF
LKSIIHSFSDLQPSLRDANKLLSEYVMDAKQSPLGRTDIKFSIIVCNGPNPPVSRETVVTRTIPRSTFDEIVIAAEDALEKCTTVTAAPIKFISSLWDKNAVAELKRKDGRVEFLVPDYDGLAIFYGRVDKIVDRVQMLEERQKYLQVLEDIARMDAARAKAEEEARMEAARAQAKAKAEEEARMEAARAQAKAKAEEEARMEAARARAKAKAEDEARMEAARARAKAKAEDEARMEAARAQAEDLLSQMSFVDMTYCRDDSCNRDHHMDMENGELKRA